MLIGFSGIHRGKKLRNVMVYICNDSSVLKYKEPNLWFSLSCLQNEWATFYVKMLWLYSDIPSHEALLLERYIRLYLLTNKIVLVLEIG